MNKDPLYQKSVAALLLVMVAGISLFFYTSQLSKEKNHARVTEQNQENLANLFEQQSKKIAPSARIQQPSINVDGITNIIDDITLFENQSTSTSENSEEALDQFLKNLE
ncbi:MAG: hypothetical protein Q8R26_01520 [bacterium]|nr:hypothetical protein [bacterium]